MFDLFLHTPQSAVALGENNVQFLGQTFTAILGSSILLDLFQTILPATMGQEDVKQK